MARCRGKTKSGSRCKRPAGEDSEYCSAHADQVEGGVNGGGKDGAEKRPDAGAEEPSEGAAARPIDASDLVILTGAAAVALFIVRRVFRIL